MHACRVFDTGVNLHAGVDDHDHLRAGLHVPGAADLCLLASKTLSFFERLARVCPMACAALLRGPRLSHLAAAANALLIVLGLPLPTRCPSCRCILAARQRCYVWCGAYTTGGLASAISNSAADLAVIETVILLTPHFHAAPTEWREGCTRMTVSPTAMPI